MQLYTLCMDKSHSNSQGAHTTRATCLETASFLLAWTTLAWHLVSLSVSTSQHQVTPFLPGTLTWFWYQALWLQLTSKCLLSSLKRRPILIKCLISGIFVGFNCDIEGCLCCQCCKVCIFFLNGLMCSLWLLQVSPIYKLCFVGSKSHGRKMTQNKKWAYQVFWSDLNQ